VGKSSLLRAGFSGAEDQGSRLLWGATVLDLGPLAEGEVGELVGALAGGRPGGRGVAELAGATEAVRVPGSLAAALDGRLEGLPEDALRVLRWAALHLQAARTMAEAGAAPERVAAQLIPAEVSQEAASAPMPAYEWVVRWLAGSGAGTDLPGAGAGGGTPASRTAPASWQRPVPGRA
jgi:hypothetical protein